MEDPIRATGQSPTLAIIVKIIGIVFILAAIVSVIGDVVLGALSSFGGSNGITTAFGYGIIKDFALIVLAIIEAVGLFKSRFWAKTFGIVLAVLFIVPDFLAIYTTTIPFYEFVLRVLTNPITLFALFAIVCLAMWHGAEDQEGQASRSTIIAIVLSVIGIGFVAVYMAMYYIYAVPVYQGENAVTQSPTTTLQASTPYVHFTVNGATGTVSVASGLNLNLAWTSDGVVSCATNNQGSSWSGMLPVSGNKTIPAQSGGFGYSYQLTCETQDGASVPSNGIIVVVQK